MKLRLSARGTGGCGCFLWRTPNAAEPGIDPALLEPIPGGEMGGNNRHYNRETGRLAQFGLSQQVQLSAGQTLWRTPKADDPNHGSASEAGIVRRLMKGQTIRLQDQINHPGLFRTPDAGCARGAQSAERFAESVKEGRLLTLNDQIAHLFPTPRASDSDKELRTPGGAMKEMSRGHGISLPSHVQIYPTPTCNDAKNNNPPSQRTENGRHSDQLNVIAGGSLNPDWVEWLMGFPIGWTADIGG
jgi:hypothetical protein